MTDESEVMWSYAQVASLREHARRQAPLPDIALFLAKSEYAVLSKARELGVPMDYLKLD